MEHSLDNPIWNALRTGNQSLARGDELVRVLPRDVGAFAGLAEYSPRAFARLQALVPPGAPVILFTAEAIALPPGWQTRLHKPLPQLVFAPSAAPAVDSSGLVALQEPDVPAMLALTALTKPGPFLPRTIDFGGYYGIFHDGQLVAMAGQRLQPAPYVEISAVCTHPAHLGRGYAARLLRHQLSLIQRAGRIPFLHAYEDNLPAYPLYLKLGFQLRQRLHVYVLEPPGAPPQQPGQRRVGERGRLHCAGAYRFLRAREAAAGRRSHRRTPGSFRLLAPSFAQRPRPAASFLANDIAWPFFGNWPAPFRAGAEDAGSG